MEVAYPITQTMSARQLLTLTLSVLHCAFEIRSCICSCASKSPIVKDPLLSVIVPNLINIKTMLGNIMSDIQSVLYCSSRHLIL